MEGWGETMETSIEEEEKKRKKKIRGNHGGKRLKHNSSHSAMKEGKMQSPQDSKHKVNQWKDSGCRNS